MTKEMPCTCKSEFQDERYGKGIRVFNEKIAGSKNNGWRCTVCGKEIK
jgi:hypothetical protein